MNVIITDDIVNIIVDSFSQGRDNARMPIDIEKIKRLREKLGLSQQEAAEKAGLATRQAWSRIESGGQPNLGLQILERVAEALEVKAKDLLK